MHNKLSVILICKNEERNLPKSLTSVSFADEVILVDSGSTDKSLDIAKTFPNVKIFQIEWLGYSKTKSFAVSKASNNWILWIDADEVVSSDLQDDWTKLSESNELNSLSAISVYRQTFFLGHPVKYSGWYPETIIRFFHKDRAQFNEKLVHESLTISSSYPVKHFTSHLLHYSYHSLDQYFYKMIQYGYLGGEELLRRKKRVSILKLFFSPLWMFIKSYFIKKGFLDGLIGVTISVGSGFAIFIKYINYFYLKKYGYVKRSDQSN